MRRTDALRHSDYTLSLPKFANVEPGREFFYEDISDLGKSDFEDSDSDSD